MSREYHDRTKDGIPLTATHEDFAQWLLRCGACESRLAVVIANKITFTEAWEQGRNSDRDWLASCLFANDVIGYEKMRQILAEHGRTQIALLDPKSVGFYDYLPRYV